jgi:hypothetical protein
MEIVQTGDNIFQIIEKRIEIEKENEHSLDSLKNIIM